jgi:hypothetical protein
VIPGPALDKADAGEGITGVRFTRAKLSLGQLTERKQNSRIPAHRSVIAEAICYRVAKVSKNVSYGTETGSLARNASASAF